MAKGRTKRVISIQVKANDASRLAEEKGTKENKPAMNCDVTCNGQSLVTLNLNHKPRSPLCDKTLPLLPEGKVSIKQAVQPEAQRKTDARPNGVKWEADTGKCVESEDRKCLPCRTEQQHQSGQSEGKAESIHAEPGPTGNGGAQCPTPVRGARCKAKPKKSSSRTSKNKGIQNRKVTDYFPIRRSSRRSKTELKCEEQKRIDDLIKNGIEEGMKVKLIEGKGRGVFAERRFQKGEYVVEYHGDLLQISEAKQREARYAQDPTTGCYMYYFQHDSKTYCVDATKETSRLGRLINHSKNGNCQTKLHSMNGEPHLILVASRDIEEGEELLYDYGDRSKDSIAAHPWLKD